MAKPVRYYALVNRGKGFIPGQKGVTNGTRIRIKAYLHPKVLEFLQEIHNEIEITSKNNPGKTPMRMVTNSQWEDFKTELKLKIEEAEGEDGEEGTMLETFQVFTTGNEPFLTIASESMKEELIDVFDLSQKANEKIMDDIMAEPVCNIFQTRTVNILIKVFAEKFGFYDQQLRDICVSDLLKISEADIVSVKGGGMSTMNEIKSYLIYRGVIEQE